MSVSSSSPISSSCLSYWIEIWIDRLQREFDLRNYSPATARNYRSYVRAFLVWRNGDPRKCTRRDVESFILGLRRRQGLAASTTNLYLDALRFFFRNVLKLPQSVDALSRLKEDQKIPQVMDITRIARLLDGTL